MEKSNWKKFRYFLLFTILSLQSNSQILENGDATFHMNGNPYTVGAFTMDKFGNTYASMSSSIIEFPSGVSVGTGGNHLFKHDVNGQLVWSYSTGSGGLYEMETDELNVIHVTGYNTSGIIQDSVNPGFIYDDTYFSAILHPNGSFDRITRFPTKPHISVMENGHLAFAIGWSPAFSSLNILGDEDLSLLGLSGFYYYIYGEIDLNGDILWREVSTQDFYTSNLTLVANCGYNDGKLYFWGQYHDNALLGTTQVNLNNAQPPFGTIYPKNSYLAVVDMQTQEIINAAQTEFLSFSSIKFDSQNRIYLATTHFLSGSLSGDGLFQSQTFPEPDTWDCYVIRLNPDLSFSASFDILGFSSTTSPPVWLNDIVVKDDNLFAVGGISFNGSLAYMYPGGPNIAGSNQVYILRLDENFEYKYSTLIPYTNSSGYSPAKNIQIDANDDNVSIIAETDSPAAPLPYADADFFIGIYKTNSNLIKGRAYKDMNQSGIFDATDKPISGNVVSTSPQPFLTVTHPDGRYEIYVDTGEYSIHLPVIPTYYSRQPDSVTFTFNGNSLIDSADLTLIPVPGGNDVKVDFFCLNPVIVGDTAIQKIIVTNEGTYTETGTLKLFPLNYSLPIGAPITTPPMTPSGSYYTYNYNNLEPGDTFSIKVMYPVPLSFLPIINDVSSTSVLVEIATDINLMNNTASLIQTVHASYDPNVKEVDKALFIAYDSLSNFEYINYTLHFQNEGNYPAMNILIEDVISNLLDIESVQVVDYSHEVRTEIVGRKLRFFFDNIQLPSASANPVESKGYVYFKIKKNTNLVVNDTIANQGFIYFDENPAILTNFTYNIIVQDIPLNDTSYAPAIVICDSAFVYGIWYYSSQIVTHTLWGATVSGSDSVIVTDLTITVNDLSTTFINDGGIISSNESNGTYQWLDCLNGYAAISGETNQEYTIPANGSYAVTVSQNGCIDTSECVVINNLSLTSPVFTNTITVFPNPTFSKVTIQFSDLQENIKTKLTGISGRVIENNHFESVQKIDIDIKGDSGIYFLHINNGNGETAIIKLMKR